MLSPNCRFVYPLRQSSRDRGGRCRKGQTACVSSVASCFGGPCFCRYRRLPKVPTRPFSPTRRRRRSVRQMRSLCSVSTRIGPQTIHINDLGLCTLARPPYPTCDPPSGTGTVADPFVYTCSSIPISNCTSGTTFALADGQVDIDFHLHTETAGAVVSAAAPVPLNPWVPIGSALGVALLAVAWQLRRRRS